MTQPLFLTECSFIPFLSLTLSFTHSLSHPHPYHPFIHSLSFPQPPSFNPSFPLSPTPHFIQSLSYPQPPSFIPSFLPTLTHTPLHPFILSFSLLPTTSFLLSFLPSFLPSFPPSLPYLHLQLTCCVVSPTRYKSWPGCCSAERNLH